MVNVDGVLVNVELASRLVPGYCCASSGLQDVDEVMVNSDGVIVNVDGGMVKFEVGC